MRRMLQRAVPLTAVSLVILVASCDIGPRRLPETGATLEGTVTYGPDKVLVAMIIAQGDSGSSTEFIGEDGHYKLQNVPLGEVRLGVNVGAGKGQLMSKQMDPANKGKLPKVTEVPAKYYDPTTSGIKTAISKGENTYNIVIPK
jgi:hypothetical protein